MTTITINPAPPGVREENPENSLAACCGDRIPRECLEATCEHGRQPCWNIQLQHWEIPQEGPCRNIISMDQGHLHPACPGRKA